MAKTIKKKITSQYFNDIASGKKNFEFRVADFDVKEGDTLLLQEWNPKTKLYSGREMKKRITYVGKFTLDSFSQRKEIEENGFYILSIK